MNIPFKKILFSAIYLLLWCVAIVGICKYYKPTKIVSYPKIPFTINGDLLIFSDGFIWDTGCSQTVFFESFSDGIMEKSKKKQKPMIDYLNIVKSLDTYFSERLFIDSLEVKNITFSTIKHDEAPLIFTQMGTQGIIGMDIIGKANWLINFSENTLEVLPHKKHSDIQEKTTFIISYKGKNKPQTELTIDNVLFENVLVDAGAFGHITLLHEDILNINQKKEPVDTVESSNFSFFMDSINEVVYSYQNMNINGMEFDTINIKNGNLRLLGLGFLRKFDKIFFDTKKQKIYCY